MTSERPPPCVPFQTSEQPGPCVDALRGDLVARKAQGKAVPGVGLEGAVGANMAWKQRHRRDDGRWFAFRWVWRRFRQERRGKYVSRDH